MKRFKRLILNNLIALSLIFSVITGMLNLALGRYYIFITNYITDHYLLVTTFTASVLVFIFTLILRVKY